MASALILQDDKKKPDTNMAAIEAIKVVHKIRRSYERITITISADLSFVVGYYTVADYVS
jgi:hypothetical protein